MQVLLEEQLRRFPTMTADLGHKIEYLDSSLIRGLISVPAVLAA
jgi:hypothetical protein